MTPEQVAEAAPLVAKLAALEERLAELDGLTPTITYKIDENKQFVVVLNEAFVKRVNSQVSDYFVAQINDVRSQLRALGVV